MKLYLCTHFLFVYKLRATRLRNNKIWLQLKTIIIKNYDSYNNNKNKNDEQNRKQKTSDMNY